MKRYLFFKLLLKYFAEGSQNTENMGDKPHLRLSVP